MRLPFLWAYTPWALNMIERISPVLGRKLLPCLVHTKKRFEFYDTRL